MTNRLVGAPTGTFLTPVRQSSIPQGTRVDVRNRFVGSWSRGFEVAERVADGYRVRRLSDNSVLPDVFPSDDVRSERRKQGLWWY